MPRNLLCPYSSSQGLVNISFRPLLRHARLSTANHSTPCSLLTMQLVSGQSKQLMCFECLIADDRRYKMHFRVSNTFIEFNMGVRWCECAFQEETLREPLL